MCAEFLRGALVHPSRADKPLASDHHLKPHPPTAPSVAPTPSIKDSSPPVGSDDVIPAPLVFQAVSRIQIFSRSVAHRPFRPRPNCNTSLLPTPQSSSTYAPSTLLSLPLDFPPSLRHSPRPSLRPSQRRPPRPLPLPPTQCPSTLPLSSPRTPRTRLARDSPEKHRDGAPLFPASQQEWVRSQ